MSVQEKNEMLVHFYIFSLVTEDFYFNYRKRNTINDCLDHPWIASEVW